MAMRHRSRLPPAEFVKSSFSGTNPEQCVGVAYRDRRYLVRNTAGPDDAEAVEFTIGEWLAFLADVEKGVSRRLGDGYIIANSPPGGRLVVERFTESEWSAFVKGVLNGEFRLHGHAVGPLPVSA
ncbi:DUF397 domain-containing protein [Amycolatopsis sp. WGS_07]|uniref:DUF397 domain-containing protein n=1 Tax=Amycolatopsis sp. WGS_07 TaxID=3076764 RepID=UPI0038739B95